MVVTRRGGGGGLPTDVNTGLSSGFHHLLDDRVAMNRRRSRLTNRRGP